jgi:hypothetical protein
MPAGRNAFTVSTVFHCSASRCSPRSTLEGPGSRDGLLAGRLVTYPLVHTVRVGTLAAAGFELLATFRRPHFTIRLDSDSTAEASRLLEAMGYPEENPYNAEVRQRRGTTPK